MHDNQEIKDNFHESQKRFGLIVCIHLVDDLLQFCDSYNLEHIDNSEWTSRKELINWK